MLDVLLGLLLGGAANQREGLPFFAGGQERKDAIKAKDETRKEEIRIAHEQMKAAAESGNMAQLGAAMESAKKLGVRDSVMAPYVEGAKQAQEFQNKTFSFLEGVAQRGQGVNQQQGTTIPGSPLPQGVPQSNSPSIPTPSAPLKGLPKSTEEIKYFTDIQEAAQKHGITNIPHFTSMIHAESNFNPSAVSPKGAIGLGQVLPSTGQGMGYTPKSLYDPKTNLDASAKYYKMMEDRFKSPDLIAAAYNAGPEAVAKHGGIPPYDETRAYVQRVNDYNKHYSNLMGTNGPSIGQPIQHSNNVHTTSDALIQMPQLFDPARGVEVTIGKNGVPTGFKIDVSKMAVPTEEALLRTIAQDPVLYRSYVQNKAFGATQFQQVHNEITGVDGVRAIRGDGVILGTTWDTQQTKLTPQQKKELAVQQSAESKAAETKSGIEALQQPYGMNAQNQPQTFGDIQVAQKAAEAGATAAATKVGGAVASQQTIPTSQGDKTVQQVTEKVPEEIRKAQVDAKAKVYSFQRFSQDVTDAGTANGKFDMNNLPIGPFSKFRELPEHYGITESKYAVDRQLFVDAMTTAIADLYSTGGKQLSEKEIENLKANVLNPELAPHEWISRAARWWEKGLDHLRSQIEVWKSEGHSVKDMEQAFQQAQRMTPWNWLPQDLRPKRVLQEKAAQFQVGQTYTNAQGKKATFRGMSKDGKPQWEMVEDNEPQITPSNLQRRK